MSVVSLFDKISSSVSNQFKFFSEGIGDKNYLENLRKNSFYLSPITEIKIAWQNEKDLLILNSVEGEFLSPNHKYLPQEVKLAKINFIKPKNFSKATPIVLHLAATGEEGYTKRFYTMAVPLANQGIASVVLENPYYGLRRPMNQKKFLIQTLSDFFKMTTSTIEEGKSILNYFYELGYKILGVTGISMGGSMAAFVGASFRVPISVVPCLAPHSPSDTFTENLLFDSIDWKRLEKDFIDKESPYKFIKDYLNEADIRKLPQPIKSSASILVGAKKDGYVLPSSVEIIHQHWKDSELRWLDSGHTSSFLFHAKDFRIAINDSLKKLKGEI